MSNPLVSVLMTVYNREKYIAEAIESVLNSSLSDFELIIVDDGSSDGSLAKAERFAEKEGRIKLYRNEKTLGQFSNRKRAASLASGSYLKYLDSDDFIYTHGLEMMVGAMEANPSAGIGFEDYCYDGKMLLPALYSPEEIYSRHFFRGGILFVGPTGSIYRREYFEELGGFDPDYDVAADYEFNLRAAVSRPVVLFQRDLYWYRRHEDQEISIHKEKYTILNSRINRKALLNEKCPLPGDLRKQAINNLLVLNARKILSATSRLKFRRAAKLGKDFRLPPRVYFLAFLPSFIRKVL